MRYRSRRALDADHAAYLTHGGMMVPIAAHQAPEVNAVVELRIEAPDGLEFILAGRARHHVPGRGLMIALEEGMAARRALDDLIESPTFRAALQDEAPNDDPVEVGTYEVQPPRIKPTPPPARTGLPPASRTTKKSAVNVLDDFEEPTPVMRPPGPPDNRPPLAAEPDPIVVSEEGSALHPDVTRVRNAARRRRPAPSADRPPTVIREARGGETYHIVVLKLFQVSDFVERYARFFTDAELGIDHADSKLERGAVALLRLTLPGHNVYEMWAVVEAVDARRFVLRVRDQDEAYRKACFYPESVAARARIQREAASDEPGTPPNVVLFTETKAPEDETKVPIRRRLARMGMDDKINLALSGNREERMALAMDSNKAVHHYLLKNAKLTLDEVAHMARLPSLNPDVLDKIAETPAYTQNLTVTKALVFNPRTPVRTAIRLLDRLPRNELVNLSKRTTMNQRLVMAAKNKIFKAK